MNDADPRVELERLQEELSSRKSTSHFTRFAVGLAAALIVAGAAGKLAWDAPGLPYFGALASLAAATLTAWAIANYRRGRRELKAELARFERWQRLRRSLGIDDPSVLLPQR